ncbi:hypothetical protein COLO4_23288 [Corchorus olitorius]|uniref:Response regulatory domain-containing protein n=1 Tax=Corchorus olitorius TaxID=93759 RepID=A0A1R3IHG2_9ROSI|nr:hypothetical protein COLO4_23288 [Corchorus olitorius]
MDGIKIIQKSSILKNSLVDNGSSSSVGGFPAGLKILIIDDDRTCLLVLERMLRKLLYQVTKCQLASDALALLRADKSRFDIVICDLHMPDMDGFKLLEIIRSEMDLPLVMMSSDDEKGVVMRGIIHGACDYLVKPIRMEAIRFIWQHVIRRKKCSLEELEQKLNNDVNRDRLLLAEQVFDAADNLNGDRLLLAEQVFDAAAEHQMSNGESLKLQDQEDGDVYEDDNGGESYSDGEGTTPKKRRMIWTKELHNLFIAAINQLGGLEQSVPKKILERMKAMNPNIDITRANIGSHLQKYRINLRKLAQPSADHNKNIYVNALFEHAASSFRQGSYRESQPISHHQLALQNLIAPQSTRFEPQNDTVAATAASTSDNGIAVSDFQSLISELSLPAEFSLHGLSRANSLQQDDFPGAVPIFNDEHLLRSVGNFTDLISDNFPSVDDLIYEPSFPVSQYDLDSIFR